MNEDKKQTYYNSAIIVGSGSTPMMVEETQVSMTDSVRDSGLKSVVQDYFESCLARHGATAKGVDWRDEDAQNLRFHEISKIFIERAQVTKDFSLVDFGCGFGSYLDYLKANGIECSYTGIDGTQSMIEAAQQKHKSQSKCRFLHQWQMNEVTDYTVVSGTFNYKGEAEQSTWQEFVLTSLDNINKFSSKGFSFNLLTSYSDKEKMVPHLYYAPASFYFDYCKSNYSRNVALLHDYEAYEFTILVRK